MSYADAANRGPPQSPEEIPRLTKFMSHSRAPPPPEVANTITSETQSLIDVDSPHISSVPSDFSSQSIQTETQADRIEREAADLRHRASQEAKKEAEAAKAKAKSAASKAEKNADNPVVLGNLVVVGIMAAVLGTQAYGRWKREGFSWGFAGTGAAILAAVGVGDYFVSRWLLQKYPPKN